MPQHHVDVVRDGPRSPLPSVDVQPQALAAACDIDLTDAGLSGTVFCTLEETRDGADSRKLEDIELWLKLIRADEVGPVTFGRLLKRFGSVDAVAREPPSTD